MLSVFVAGKRRLSVQDSCIQPIICKNIDSIISYFEILICFVVLCTQTTASDSLQNIAKRHLCGTKNSPFTPDLRRFAITLHFYSARAYNYVRKSFNHLLPSERTIRNWYQVIDGKPGFTDESFRSLRQKAEEKVTIINLVIDEMAIRQHIDWNGHNYSGFVNMGANCVYDHDNLPLAKNALVFLAVAINGHWKVPVGYFFIDNLNATERANLLNMCLSLLHKSKVQVLSVTFDGAPVNKSMCTRLGATLNYDNLCSYIIHPDTGEKVFIFLDPSHALKLVRNTLGEKGILLNESNKYIKWEFIVKLYNLEKVEGLKSATKLTGRHINYHNEKMNVRLAAQVLSDSVSKALTYCKQIGYADFQGSLATAHFCSMINKAFDILNSRSKFSKGNKYNLPISDNTINEYSTFVSSFKNYIYNLKDINGTRIVHSTRSTGFIGMIICLENALQLYHNLHYKKYIEYLLTFKLSQDHLESFFSAIRSRGGFNSNPTCMQFESAYKKMLVHHEIVESEYGNCTMLESTSILPAHTSTNNNLNDNININDINEENSQCNIDENMTVDHNYISSIPSLSPFIEGITEYIAGFVIRQLKRKITCSICKSHLESEISNSVLLNLKDKGKLIKPAKDVCFIIEWAERIIRQYQNDIFKRNIKSIITNKITQRVLPYIFSDLNDHIMSQEPFENHKKLLIVSLLDIYLNVRFHHIAKTYNKKKKK